MALGKIRLTTTTMAVIELFRTSPDVPLYGAEIVKATGIKTGTIYPILERLERTGWAKGSWERLTAERMGRPLRRYYQLTVAGRKAAENLRKEQSGNLKRSGRQ